MQSIDLSIVIISFNTLALTRACLESVMPRLGDLRVELIVVDNASQDGSVEMVRDHYPSIKLIKNNENLGFAAANNQAFSMVQGEFVLLLNSDTEILGEVIPNSVDYLRTHPEVGAMGCRVLNSDMTMQATCSGYPTLFRLLQLTLGLDRLPILKAFDGYLLRGWQRDIDREVEVISGCYLLVRRTIIESIGALDDAFFFFAEETDWCLRMRRAGWQLRFSPVGEIIHHGGGSVKKLNHRRDVMLTEALIRLHWKNGGIIPATLAFLILAFFNLSRAVILSLFSIFNGECRARAKHFRAVAFCTLDTWPTEKGH